MRTILVVDDESLIVSLLRRALTQAGYNVIEATCPKQAVELCEDPTRVIDAVLTDLMMPGMNGRKLGDHVAKLRPGTPILYMSGYADADNGALVQGLSRRSILTKPFTLPSLLAAVSSMFEPPRPSAFAAPPSQINGLLTLQSE